MTSYYEGRDLLRTEDIYGSQSATAIKHRNIDQEQYVPVVIKNVPDVYQRQAELHKSIRNPHFNDYRYDLNQQHPHFIPNSHSSQYKDSLDNFKQEQEAIKTQILKNNSLINYDLIRMQKNKNSYEKLNPPFANLHSEINERQYQYNTLKSPMNQYLKNSQSNGFLSNNSSANLQQQNNQIQDQSPTERQQVNAQQKILASRSASIPQLNQNINLSQNVNSQKLFKPEEQSPINLYQANQQQQQQVYQQQQMSSPTQASQAHYQNNAQPQQQQVLNHPQNNFQDYIINDQYQQSNNQQQIQQQQQQYQQQNAQPQQYQDQISSNEFYSPEKVTQSSTISNKKTYKPYNIIIHNRYIPYTPKFDLPEIKWDKYDRQMFKNFDQKAMPPVEIIKNKNQKMNSFPDYTTWNQRYGDPK